MPPLPAPNNNHQPVGARQCLSPGNVQGGLNAQTQGPTLQLCWEQRGSKLKYQYTRPKQPQVCVCCYSKALQINNKGNACGNAHHTCRQGGSQMLGGGGAFCLTTASPPSPHLHAIKGSMPPNTGKEKCSKINGQVEAPLPPEWCKVWESMGKLGGWKEEAVCRLSPMSALSSKWMDRAMPTTSAKVKPRTKLPAPKE